MKRESYCLKYIIGVLFICCSHLIIAQQNDLFKLRSLKSRAATAENKYAEKGKGGMSGNGMKASPAIKDFKAGTTDTLLYTPGPGMVRHIWCTMKPARPQEVKHVIIRMYWEDSSIPSVEVPLHDFFGISFGADVPLTSQLMSIQPTQGYNCDIPMPFKSKALITITNHSETDLDWFFYQVDFTLGDQVEESDGRFHAFYNHQSPTNYGEDFTILETSGAKGVYLGCVMGVSPCERSWWGEGEVKFFLDGDTTYPTICGTGIEDYFGAAWGLSAHCTPYRGAPLVEQQYTSLYRFHVTDPIYFENEIRITVQQMGLIHINEAKEMYGDSLIYRRMDHPRRSSDSVFYLRSDNVSSVAYWYQFPLMDKRPPLPSKLIRNSSLYQHEKEERQSISAPM